MRTILLIGAAATGLLLAGCADEGYYGAGYGAGQGYGYDYAGPGDVWYDGYYGPYADGYWDTGGVFFFRDNGGHYVRDDAGHFRHERFEGSRRYRSSPHRGDNR